MGRFAVGATLVGTLACVMMGGQARAYAMSHDARSTVHAAPLLRHQVTQTRFEGARSINTRRAQALNASGVAKLRRGN